MKRAILLLRFCYWLGAIADALSAVVMLSPKLGGAMYGIEGFAPGVEYRYAMGVGASLMLGWTVLLLWADRKPVERRGVLLVTVFPVVAGIALSGIWAVTRTELVSVEHMIPEWIFQALLTALFLYAYWYGGSAEGHPS